MKSILSPLELLDEAIGLFVGGHETTASALMWVWYELSQHPDVATQWYAEIDSLGGKLPTLEALPRLPYTEALIKETLRRYPPLYFMARTPNQPTTIAGYEIPQKNVSVLLNIYTVHHDERYYDNPAVFRPERWLPDSEGITLEKKLPRGAYVPFGDGPRVCIGNHFAMLEMRLVLATMAQCYRLELIPEPQITIRAAGTLIPRHGLMMRLIAR